jgi:hypothetical protein
MKRIAITFCAAAGLVGLSLLATFWAGRPDMSETKANPSAGATNNPIRSQPPPPISRRRHSAPAASCTEPC